MYYILHIMFAHTYMQSNNILCSSLRLAAVVKNLLIMWRYKIKIVQNNNDISIQNEHIQDYCIFISM